MAIILDASGQPRMLGEGAFGQAQAHAPPLVEMDRVVVQRCLGCPTLGNFLLLSALAFKQI